MPCKNIDLHQASITTTFGRHQTALMHNLLKSTKYDMLGLCAICGERHCFWCLVSRPLFVKGSKLDT